MNNSIVRSYYLQTQNSDKHTENNSSKFLTFVWLLSLKCHACLSIVIKIRKMTKLRQKLQINHFDVICTHAIGCQLYLFVVVTFFNFLY